MQSGDAGEPERTSGSLPDVLPDTVPVTMPILPVSLLLTTDQQFKAIADPLRTRILGVIQHQPATAKQIADRLGEAPGTIGHHVQVLEAAGLAQVVARRLVRGIVAKYYARTARIFNFDLSDEVTGGTFDNTLFLRDGANELSQALVTLGAEASLSNGLPHARLSPERAEIYRQRLERLVDDLISEPADPAGEVYGLSYAFYKAPAYLQPSSPPAAPTNEES